MISNSTTSIERRLNTIAAPSHTFTAPSYRRVKVLRGCESCRRRKIKCNWEPGAMCDACMRLGLVCEEAKQRDLSKVPAEAWLNHESIDTDVASTISTEPASNRSFYAVEKEEFDSKFRLFPLSEHAAISIDARHSPKVQADQVEVISNEQRLVKTTNSSIRKRTKTGCLTCRKRRIKCGEERPTCANCIKSKRHCEGYNQRVVFKPPIGEWPNHPGVVSTLQDHNSMLPGLRTKGSPNQYRGVARPSSLAKETTLFTDDIELTKIPLEKEFYRKAIALCKFEQQNHNQLPLEEGQAIIALKRRGHGWLEARDPKAGNSGFVPEAYVRLLRDEEQSTGAVNPLAKGNSNDTMGQGEEHPKVPTSVDPIASTDYSTEYHRNSKARKSVESDVMTTEQSSFSDDSISTSEDEKAIPLVENEKRRVVQRVMTYFYKNFRATSPLSPESGGKRNGMPSATHYQLSPLDPPRDFNDVSHSPKGNQLSLHQQIISSPAISRQRGASEQGSHVSSRKVSTDRCTDIHGSTVPSLTALGKRPIKDGYSSDSDQEEDDSIKKRPKKEDMDGQCRKNRRFACPYFKRDPERYVSRRSCVGPGWEEVRRVKEHLYRNHALSIFCPRCYEIFKVESLLHDHQRDAVPCVIQPKATIEGFDKLQEKKLRSRKKVRPELNEEGKWKEMYRILFPGEDEANTPSPYLDADWEKIYQRGRSPITDEFVRYEQFLRRELPSAVRRELESAVERELSPVEEKLRSQLVDLVHNLQPQLFQTYTQSRRAKAPACSNTSQTAPLGSDKDICPESGWPDNAAHPETESAPEIIAFSEEPTIEEQLAPFQPPPALEAESAYDFDAVLFQFHELGEFCGFEDSTYGSSYADPLFIKEGWDDCSDRNYDPENNGGEGSSGTY